MMIMFSCSKNESKFLKNDPTNAECILSFDIDDYDEEEFIKHSTVSDDGYTLTSIEHTTFAYTELYQLSSPNGNVCLIAAGAQEQCGLTGYTIEYNSDGTVSCVNFVGDLDYDDYGLLSGTTKDIEIMKKWLKTSSDSLNVQKFYFIRDKEKNITKIGDIEIPYNYKAKYYLSKWGPFWGSDISGGVLSFFIELQCQETDGSYVNYIYLNNRLLAELAYWKGTFIKARTYNKDGVMVEKYSDRDMDVIEQAYYDYNANTKWYVDE